YGAPGLSGFGYHTWCGNGTQITYTSASYTGKDQEILFLQLMIRHHEGGVQMGRGLLKLSDRDEVATMAQHIVDGQTGEIELMTDMLRQRGAQRLPSIL
ncbi:DUF305 domain-containing protein, partial [Streptosporangium sp. NPDC001682]